MLSAARSDLARLREISRIVGRHGYAHLADSLQRGEPAPDDIEAQREVAEMAPNRLRTLLQDLGPTFIKLGQVLSTRADLIPTDYQRELAKLQDEVAPAEWSTIEGQLATAWGRAPSEVVPWIDESPLATASIAQVHRARLEDGREVVLKVQRPNLAATIRADLDLLHVLARILDATVEEAGLYRPVAVVQAFEKALIDELDFELEAHNARVIAQNFAADDRVMVPETVDALSGPTVLVMEFVSGAKLTELDPDRHDVEAITQTLLDAAFQMAFVDGVFHGDPHPGNALVLDDGRLCMLDYGLVGRLSPSMQQTLIQLSLAVATRDADATTRLIYRIGQPQERVPLNALRDDISELMGRYLVRRLDEVDASSLINELMDRAIEYRIRVPPDYALLARAAVLIEGVVRTLTPNLDITSTVMPYAERLMAERYSPQAVGQMAIQAAVGVIDGVHRLPLQAYQLASDLEGGRLSVRVSNPDLDRMTRSLNDLGTKVYLGMVTMGMVLGTFFIAARYPVEWLGWNLWGVLGALLSLTLFGMVVSWHFFYTRGRKVSLKLLLRLFRR